jgi:hypothetical protein
MRKLLHSPDADGAGGGSTGADNTQGGDSGAAVNGATLTTDKVAALIDQKINDALGARLGRFGDKLVGNVEKLLEDHGLDLEGDGAKGKGKGGKDADDPRLKALSTEVEELRNRDRNSRINTALNDAMAAAKMTGEATLLRDGLRAKVEESNGEFFIDDKPLSAFVSDFAKTPEGRRYIPAAGGGGSGATRSEGSATTGGAIGGIADTIRKSLADQTI